MDKFSVFNYANLSESQKVTFDKALAQRLSSFLSEIKNDDVLGALAIDEFVASNGSGNKSTTLVGEVYSRISGGIQVGSGNQNLFNGVLNAYAEAWGDIDKA